MDIDNLAILVMVKAEGGSASLFGKVSMAPIVDLIKQSLSLILGVN